MNGYITNIEKETLENEDYRRVLFTGKHSQLVVMAIKPGEEIGKETHHLDQFIRIEQGQMEVVLDGESTTVQDAWAVVVPAGVEHNFINRGEKTVKLYTLYSPPEHKDGIVEKTKADEFEEHFDGITSLDK